MIEEELHFGGFGVSFCGFVLRVNCHKRVVHVRSQERDAGEVTTNESSPAKARADISC